MIVLFKITIKMVDKLKILARQTSYFQVTGITVPCCIKMNQSATIVYVYALASFALIKLGTTDLLDWCR